MTNAQLIAHAFAEDLPKGDLTTDSLGLKAQRGRARLIAGEDLVLSGRALFEDALKTCDRELEFNWQFKDGDLCLAGQNVAWLKGDLGQILRGERVALNFLSRSSGVATLTRCFVRELRETKCRVLATRQTVPLWRDLDYQAVRAGGGVTPNASPSDTLRLEANHVRAGGGLGAALARVRQRYSGPLTVTITNAADLAAAVAANVGRVVVAREDFLALRGQIPADIEVEVAGRLAVADVRAIALAGAQFIRVDALTHGAPSAEFSLHFEWTEGG